MSETFHIVGKRHDGTARLLAELPGLRGAAFHALELAEELSAPEKLSIYRSVEIIRHDRLVISIMIAPYAPFAIRGGARDV